MSNVNTVAEHNNAWKGRGTLANLVKELKRQKESRVDFVTDTRNLSVGLSNQSKNGLVLKPLNAQAGEWIPDGQVHFNKSAYAQLLEKASPSIPKRFGDELLDKNPARLVDLLNGLHLDTPEKRLVRCLDGNVRGWLSSKYRIIDNYDMAFTCMDEAQRKEAQVIEASLSDTRMRIKFTTQQVWDTIAIKQASGPQGTWFAGALGNKELQGKTILGAKINGELPGGPGTVHPVITVSNSETGHGGFHVRLGLLMGICFNVATLEEIVTQIHLGGELAEGIFSAETIAADSQVIMKKAADAVRAAFDQDKFKAMLAKARNAMAQVVEKPTAAVEHIIEVNNINEEHKEALLEYFLKDYDQTAFGLAQAVSRRAQDTDDSDEANELELLAGKIIKTPSLVAIPA